MKKKILKIICITLLILGVVFLIGTVGRMDFLAEQGKEFPEFGRNLCISLMLMMPYFGYLLGWMIIGREVEKWQKKSSLKKR